MRSSTWAARSRSGTPRSGAGRGAAPVPVTVIVPGTTEVASVVTATGSLAARRDQPVGVAGEGVGEVAEEVGGATRERLVHAGLDLAQRGQPVVVLDNDCKLSTGSRAICFSKRTLEIWDRLGVGQPMVDKGVSWNLGKVFARDQSLYQFDLLPEAGHERPAIKVHPLGLWRAMENAGGGGRRSDRTMAG